MPSPADVRRRALLAAAKVTLSLSALACADTESPLSTASLTPGTGGQSAAGVPSAGHAGQGAAGQGSAAAGGSSAGASVATTGGSSGKSGHAGSGTSGQGGSVYALACGLPSDTPPTDETVACCGQRLDVVLPLDPEQPWVNDPSWPATLEASEQACCEVVVAGRDAALPDPNEPFDELTWRQASRCCPYLDQTGPIFFGPTCTPWGPPMPPAMPAHLMLA